MMYFEYKAYGHNQVIKSGIIQAESRDAAVVILIAANLNPIVVDQVREYQEVYDKMFKMKRKVQQGQFPIKLKLESNDKWWRNLFVVFSILLVILAILKLL